MRITACFKLARAMPLHQRKERGSSNGACLDLTACGWTSPSGQVTKYLVPPMKCIRGWVITALTTTAFLLLSVREQFRRDHFRPYLYRFLGKTGPPFLTT